MFIGFLIGTVGNAIEKSKVKKIGIALLIQCFVLGFTMVILQTIILTKIRNQVLEILSDPKT
jgi:hypothetical protein